MNRRSGRKSFFRRITANIDDATQELEFEDDSSTIGYGEIVKRTLVSFEFYWSLFIFVCDLSSMFEVTFWIGMDSYPHNLHLAFMIITESILFFDFIFKALITVSAFRKLNFYWIFDFSSHIGWLYFILNFLSCLPQVLFISLLRKNGVIEVDGIDEYNLLLLIKLGSFWDLEIFINEVRQRLVFLNFKIIVLVKFVENMILLVFVTHLAGCIWTLVNKYQGPDLKPSYFERAQMKSQTYYTLYISSVNWAVSCMTGNSFGDVTPWTNWEMFVSIIAMVLGGAFYGKIFADFECIMHLQRGESIEKAKKFEYSRQFCIQRNTPASIRQKVQHFFTADNESYIEQLPISLQTEIALYSNLSMIQKTKLFNIGSPNFVMAVARNLEPRSYFENDVIMREGETAEELFFIKSGKVEVLAIDKTTSIAILEEGAFFGEIGLLITGKRSVTVRALTFSCFQVLNKEKFNMLMELFPDQRSLLKKIGYQRLKICKPEDVNWTSNFIDGGKSPLNKLRLLARKETFARRQSETQKSFKKKVTHDFRKLLPNIKEEEHKKLEDFDIPVGVSEESSIEEMSSEEIDAERLFHEELNFVDQDTLFHPKLIIIPMSNTFIIFSFILLMALGHNIFYLPFSLCFGFDYKDNYILIDFIAISIYFFDIFFNWLTTFKNKIGLYEYKKRKLFQIYLNKGFFWDIIAFIPFDYLLLLLGLSTPLIRWIRLLRLIKIKRVYEIVNMLFAIGAKSSRFSTFFIMVIIHIFLNHLSACFMFAIAYAEYYNQNVSNMIKFFDSISLPSQAPLLEKGVSVQYVNFYYWSLCCCTTGAYGDIRAVTNWEVTYQNLVMLFFRVYLAFLSAEVTNLASSAKTLFSEHLDKLDTVRQWMDHIKTPKNLKDRVLKFYRCIWKKFKGIDDNTVLQDLPESIRQDLLLFLLEEVVERVKYFPKNSPGITLNIIKCLKIIIIPKGEYICRTGDVAREMFFILEGEAVVLNPGENKVLSIMRSFEYFGEIAILSGIASRRTATVKALSDMSLAILKIEDFNFLCKEFPVIYESIQKLADERRQNFISASRIGKLLDSSIVDENKGSNDFEGFQNERKSKFANFGIKINETEFFIGLNRGMASISEEGDCTLLQGRQGAEEINNENELKGEKSQKNLPSQRDLEMKLKINPDLDQKQENLESEDKTTNSPKRSEKRGSSSNLIEGSSDDKDIKPQRQEININNISGINEFINASNLDSIDWPEEIIEQHQPGKVYVTKVPALETEDNKFNNGGNVSEKGEMTNKSSARKGSEEGFFTSQLAWLLDDSNEKFTQKNNDVPIKITMKMRFMSFAKGLLKSIGSFFSKHLIMFIFSVFNIFFIPVNLAFTHASYSGVLIAVEIIFVIYLLVQLNKKIRKRRRRYQIIFENAFDRENKTQHNKKVFLLKVFMKTVWYLTYIIPFALLFEVIGVREKRTSIFLIALQLIRITNIQDLSYVFSALKQKNMALASILQILFSYLIFSHVSACIFIMMAYAEDDFNASWFSKIPAPQWTFPNNRRETFEVSASTIYIHSLYWFYVTSSHVGVGDVTAVNTLEKAYNIIIMLLGLYTFCFFFGNLASIVENAAPAMKSNLEKQYKKVSSLIKSLNLGEYSEKIETYFNYLWRNNKGIDENEILEELPNSLRIQIQISRYHEIFCNSSFFFKNQYENSGDYNIITSVLKYISYETVLPDEIIRKAGDHGTGIGIIIEGEAELLSFDLKLVKGLHPGDYFGSYQESFREYGFIISKKICKIAILSLEDFIVLSEAFPDWGDRIRKNYDEMKKSILDELEFCKVKMEKGEPVDINEELVVNYNQEFELLENQLKEADLRMKFSKEFLLKNKKDHLHHFTDKSTDKKLRRFGKSAKDEDSPKQRGTKRNLSQATEKKISLAMSMTKLIEWENNKYILPNSRIKIVLDTIHIYFMLYNTYFLPFYVAFDIGNISLVVVLEVLFMLEAIVHIIAELMTAQYIDGILSNNIKLLLKKYYNENNLILDLYMILPLNMILNTFEEQTILISVFRITRLIQSFYLTSHLNKLEMKKRSLTRIINLSKSVLILTLVWHWSSCTWFWINKYIEKGETNTWMIVNKLDQAPLFVQYLNSLMFTMSIASTPGFSEQMIYNDFERVCFIFYIIIGDALFAVAFGMMVTNTEIFPEKFEELFSTMRKIYMILKKNNLPLSIKQRIEQYFGYIINLRHQNYNSLPSIKHLLPGPLYKELMFQRSKEFLVKLPIFKEINSPSILKEISVLLEYSIFLPNDYIIYRGDIGEEMYFIIQGNVKVLSTNEEDVIVKLEKGNYFGEIALFNTAKRMCSVVSGTFCELYILRKKDLDEILKKYPQIEKKFKDEGMRRLNQFKKDEEAKKNKMISNSQKRLSVIANFKADDYYGEESESDNSENSSENSELAGDKLAKGLVALKSLKKSGDLNMKNSGELNRKKSGESFMKRSGELVKKGSQNELKPAQSLKKRKSSIMVTLKKEENPKSKSNHFNIRKVLMLNDENPDENMEIFDDSQASVGEFVDENELIMSKKIFKQSRRRKTKARERRYSRISLGKEIQLSQSTGLRLMWGMHIAE